MSTAKRSEGSSDSILLQVGAYHELISYFSRRLTNHAARNVDIFYVLIVPENYSVIETLLSIQFKMSFHLTLPDRLNTECRTQIDSAGFNRSLRFRTN